MAHKVTFEIHERITSSQRTWGAAASNSMMCYYRVEQRDLIEEELLTYTVDTEDGSPPQVYSIVLSSQLTKWYYVDTVSRVPVGRVWTNLGPCATCPPVGPNWMGPIHSLNP